ncbi:MAG TPA: HlyD family efflux transporter periplasmic adaptor subunit [Pseudonocardia sp.]|jgi:multidrug resistance efflux pump|uniref:HlyD family secretion protein n=1 Tax=Pseudonocardia sp. TaxID=60912 RepID=UPI002C9E122F|nr:HlyD family efflux transporter periplasmic adaptor subunit [Pseudonocardia sp.]HTF53311.1 HlyD family efflux transporter periplasmic adaptor subunit [Pseudonocardia sp.]
MLPVAPKRSNKLKRSTKIGLLVIALVSLLEASALSGTYLLHSRHYVSTDNAQVDGDKIEINAPTTGTIADWALSQGSVIRENELVGRIQGVGGGAQPKRAVRAPGAGTIAVNNTVAGQYVLAGTKLATAYDFNSIYLTARVEETEIAEVRVGGLVDISVDAFPGVTVGGQVSEIQGSTAGEFSFFPSPDSDPSNPQKIDQYIPVKITIMNANGVTLVPGMNANVRIHKT